MATQTIPLVSVQEYLKTVYEPDCDYVDGEVEERNVGEVDHSEISVGSVELLSSQSQRVGFACLDGNAGLKLHQPAFASRM